MTDHVRFIFEKRESRVDLESILSRLRNRSWLLRVQATICMVIIALISIALIVFLAIRSQSYGSESSVRQSSSAASQDIKHNLFAAVEQRHIELSGLIDGFIQATNFDANLSETSSSQQERAQARILKLPQIAEDLRETKRSILSAVAADREAMATEVRRVKDERDSIAREAAERQTLIRLIGEGAFRIGAILVSIYFMSILANISKYWLRVADHLSAVADTLDVLAAANMDLAQGINALSPHPIDFQAEEPISIKTLKELLSITPGGRKT